MRLRMSFASPLNVLGGAVTCSYHIKLNGVLSQTETEKHFGRKREFGNL